MTSRFVPYALFMLVGCAATPDNDTELVEESVESAVSGQSEAAVITFDGTATASWTSSRRGTGSISLDCIP